VKETFLRRLAASLVSRPFVYELVQSLAGQAKVAERLRATLDRLPPHRRALDVGSAAGGFALRIGIAPVCLDLDPRPLLALRRREPSAKALAADAARLPFSDGAFDLTLCVAIVHHIDDGTLGRVVTELSRVTSGHLLLLEPLRNDARRASRWLWRYDRGRHPRTREQLVAILERSFEVDEAMEFTVYHQYLLCVARPVASVRGQR
jgi:ubiquinone/menaquinone biosynthesis C-methylase UbiE